MSQLIEQGQVIPDVIVELGFGMTKSFASTDKVRVPRVTERISKLNFSTDKNLYDLVDKARDRLKKEDKDRGRPLTLVEDKSIEAEVMLRCTQRANELLEGAALQLQEPIKRGSLVVVKKDDGTNFPRILNVVIGVLQTELDEGLVITAVNPEELQVVNELFVPAGEPFGLTKSHGFVFSYPMKEK